MAGPLNANAKCTVLYCIWPGPATELCCAAVDASHISDLHCTPALLSCTQAICTAHQPSAKIKKGVRSLLRDARNLHSWHFCNRGDWTRRSSSPRVGFTETSGRLPPIVVQTPRSSNARLLLVRKMPSIGCCVAARPQVAKKVQKSQPALNFMTHSASGFSAILYHCTKFSTLRACTSHWGRTIADTV